MLPCHLDAAELDDLPPFDPAAYARKCALFAAAKARFVSSLIPPADTSPACMVVADCEVNVKSHSPDGLSA